MLWVSAVVIDDSTFFVDLTNLLSTIWGWSLLCSQTVMDMDSWSGLWDFVQSQALHWITSAPWLQKAASVLSPKYNIISVSAVFIIFNLIKLQIYLIVL